MADKDKQFKRHILKPLLSIYSLSFSWSGLVFIDFSLFLLWQVPSLLFFAISVTAPEVHESRSVSAKLLLVT